MTTSPAGLRAAANGQATPAYLPVSIGHLWYVMRSSDSALAAYDYTEPTCLPGTAPVQLTIPDDQPQHFSVRSWAKASTAWKFIEDKLSGEAPYIGGDLFAFFPQRKD